MTRQINNGSNIRKFGRARRLGERQKPSLGQEQAAQSAGNSSTSEASVAEFPSANRKPVAVATTLAPGPTSRESTLVREIKGSIQSDLMDRIDLAAAVSLSQEELTEQIKDVIAEILAEQKINLNHTEHNELVTKVVDEMVGLGPLEPLLADDTVADIMVNGAKQVYVERHGKLECTDVTFADDRHVLNTAIRIANRVGRRIDETTPLVDARLEDGSRVNIIIPPLAIDGPTISIRKFSSKKLGLDWMAQNGSMTPEIAAILRIAAASRLNVLIAGGTGSGKTTLLNAMSQMIDASERIVTVEDAAELQLQQPHVVRLETRPPNLEGKGEISMRDLVKNALRMRPDRIVLGEVRGDEAVDMLQAMNTGHEGSLGTIHANNPREALIRLENLFAMAGFTLPSKAVRTQIAAAIDIIVQVTRMRDGSRRITQITEVVGMEGDNVLVHDLFTFEYEGEEEEGKVLGSYVYTGIQPRFMPKARYFGLDRELMQILHGEEAA